MFFFFSICKKGKSQSNPALWGWLWKYVVLLLPWWANWPAAHPSWEETDLTREEGEGTHPLVWTLVNQDPTNWGPWTWIYSGHDQSLGKIPNFPKQLVIVSDLTHEFKQAHKLLIRIT